jgi:WD40 repeat protein
MVLGSTGESFVAVVEYSVEAEIGALKVFGLRTGRVLYEKQSPLYGPLSISSDDKLLAYSTAGKIHLGRFDPLKPAMEELTPLQAGAERFSFVGSSHVLAVAQSPDVVWLWDQDSEKEVDRLSVPIGHYMFTVSCSDQGNLLVIGANRSLSIIQTRPLKLIHRFQVFESTGVQNVAISPDATYLAASSYDYGDNDQPGHGQVKVWRLDRLFSK